MPGRDASLIAMRVSCVMVVTGAWLALAWPAGAESEAGGAWERLQSVVQAVSQTPAERVVIDYDRGKRILKVGRELRVNPATLRRTIQVVPVDRLVTDIPIEGVARLADPWVKVRTRDGRKHVQVRIEREINGEDISFDTAADQDTSQAFLIIPCPPRDVPRLRDAVQEFLREESRGR